MGREWAQGCLLDKISLRLGIVTLEQGSSEVRRMPHLRGCLDHGPCVAGLVGGVQSLNIVVRRKR